MAEEKKPPKYVVIRKSGDVMLFNQIGLQTTSTGPYLDILMAVAVESESAGADYDIPDKLLLNGEVVVDSGLLRLALAYSLDKSQAWDAADRACRGMHSQGLKWLPEAERVYHNPPGVDHWTVTRADISFLAKASR